MASVAKTNRAPPAKASLLSGVVSEVQRNSKTNVITPGKGIAGVPVDQKMMVEKEIVDELLLVCGVIGTTTSDGDKLVPVTDCLNWLQDLQRALRRDDDHFRPISLLMGKWKVVEQKLLPLVLTCRYDSAIVLTVVKILVILTKPLAASTKTAGKLIVDTSSKADPAIVSHQIKLRENALEQARLLVDYKRIFAHHASHHCEKQGTGLLSIFVSLLAEPLSRSGASRTDADHLTTELVLHLFRNLLAAEPLLNSSSDASRQNNQLHQELIALFEKELVLEIILVLGQDIEARENAQYNLLVMEMLDHLLKTQDPAAVAGARVHSNHPPKMKMSALSAKLKHEQSHRLSIASSRHGHFGGTWMKQKSDGKTSYVTSSKQLASNQASTSTKRKNQAEPFIGSGKNLLAHSRRASMDNGPASSRANLALNNFCKRFIKDCYGPIMKSLKNEFRRDSHRLESGDKVGFFRIVWFFCQWWRFARPEKNLGQLIFTMDVFTFNLVLSSTDTYHQSKNSSRLAQSVALYSEMMYLLIEMHSSNDETETVMSKGLLDRLFYGSEPLDRLPKLLNRWSPGVSTREYLCDLVELCYTSLKLLDMNRRESQAVLAMGQKDKSDKIQKMRFSAAQFDVEGYFLRKCLSNQLISMHIHLLGQYKINSTNINHRVLWMFLRIMRTEIATPDVHEVGVPVNPLGIQKVTLEPLLFNTHLLVTAQKILGDNSINADDKDDKELILFCTTFYNRFMLMARKNPMIFVECLFRQSAPTRFCELVSNHYVSEELRMLAEREILLEEQQHLRVEEGARVEDEDEDEHEFDHSMGAPPESCKTRSSSQLDDLSDDERIFSGPDGVDLKDTLSVKPASTFRPFENASDEDEPDMPQKEVSKNLDHTSVPCRASECYGEMNESRSSPASHTDALREGRLRPAKRGAESVAVEDRSFEKLARWN